MNRVTIGMVLTLSAAITFAASSCSSGANESPTSEGSLQGLDHDDAISITNSDASRKPTWVYGSIPVCLVGGGKAQLTELRLDATAGVELVAAGVQPLSEGGSIASAAGPLPATYDRIPGATVTTDCDAKSGTELAIEVKRTSAVSAKINSVELTYTDGATVQKLRYAYSVVLCSGPTATDLPECANDS